MTQGNRIALRQIRDEAECRQLYEAYNDLAERALADHDETFAIEPRLADFREHGMWTEDKGILLIVDQADAAVGLISFQRTTPLECDIGYRLLYARHRRKGLMSEALPLFSRYLFQRFPEITRLQIRTAHDNEASIRLARRCGFTIEGTLRNAYAYRGRICDWVVLSLLREECLETSTREPHSQEAND